MRHEVRTSIGGSIEAHVTSVGTCVEIGAVLLTIECMKMMLPVEAPAAGVVTWLKECAATIEVDDVVVVIED